MCAVTLWAMTALSWERHPKLNKPVVVAAFGGWNDAGDAATSAVRFLAGQWHARSFAEIDPEEFFNFTETRPTVRLTEGVTRSIQWPTNRFTAATVPGQNRDVVFIHGTEPQLKWRTFCDAIINCVQALDASMVITLGGLLADVPHTRPASVTANTNNTDLLRRLDLELSRYEGPTGIVGIVHDACARAGIQSASLWVTVPHYVSQTPSPKATLALVERTCELLDVPVETVDLEVAAAAYEQQVTELIEDDDDIAAYVAQLEETTDAEADHANNLAAEAERFLRGQSE